MRGHKNQPRPCLGGTRLRRASKRVENADYHCVSSDYADPDGDDYREAENQRHEKRNHVPPDLEQSKLKCSNQMPQTQLSAMQFLQSNRVAVCR
jgi:hypothetical protein